MPGRAFMIFATLLFLISSVLFTYRSLTWTSTRFLYGIIIGWALSFISSTLYLSKFVYYYNIIHTFFNFSPGTWNYLILTKFNPILLIRMLNGGVNLFYSSLLLFAVAFTQSYRPSLRKTFYIGVAVIFLVQLIVFDPSFNIYWQNHFDNGSLLNNIHLLMANVKYVMIVVACVIMLNFYLNYPKIKFIKHLSAFYMIALIPAVVIHLLIFSWAPSNLVQATVLKGYYNYLKPPLEAYPFVLATFPYTVYLALAFLIFVVYKYKSIEFYRKNRDIQISKNIDTATIGTRAFTHAIKNHLVAIESETRFVKSKHSDDSEINYSLDLILQSCDAAMRSIDTAADKLKHIALNLQPTPLDRPVKHAISLLRNKETSVDLKVRMMGPIPTAYIDIQHMSDAIYNLLTNALESLSRQQDGIITVSIGRQNGWAFVRVADNGPGIPPDQLDLIFDPFYTTKSSMKNWGIGLSYCHKIVTGHDGKIQAESPEGQGAVFTIYLPIV